MFHQPVLGVGVVAAVRRGGDGGAEEKMIKDGMLSFSLPSMLSFRMAVVEEWR